LEVVPDNVVTLEDVFSRKSEAWNALAKIYSYMPKDDRSNSSWFLGNEYMGAYPNATGDRNLTAFLIMMGQQTANDPFLPSWSKTGNNFQTPVRPLYEGIRVCNIFLQYIDGIGDMTEAEKADWKAQAKFLKAYYHFVLLQKYGPIVISDQVVSPDAVDDELFQRRSKVEDCFDYIIRVMDEAIPSLNTKASTEALGQVDKLVAMSIKARVMVFRASPFYNGNTTLYSDFLDPYDNKPFFPLVENKEKWKEAIDAIQEAIDICLENGVDLYTYEGKIYEWEKENFAANEETMKKFYDLRMLLVDPWNKEIIWGYSNVGEAPNGNMVAGGSLAAAAQMMLWNEYNSSGGNNNGGYDFAWNWLCATYNVAERYYTKNGLPLDEDLEVDMSTIHQLTKTPGPLTDPDGYKAIHGILQPDFETIRFHLNREMRFYANLGISGGYWRSHVNQIILEMYAGARGGINHGGHQNPSSGDRFWATGMGIQKLVHPESKTGHWSFTVQTAFPIIRMADLYLMKAEAENEYAGPSQKVYDALNKVRRRAGIPDVEVVWADASLTKHPGKHQEQSGLRDIILRERSIELAFEGVHYWDMLRQKRSQNVFNTPTTGWTITASAPRDFFVLSQVQPRRFTTRDYLWPIDLNELNTNDRLVQNPGW
jgi:hypothetical protein